MKLFQVGKLAQWIRDPNLLISLPATKALGNLDQEYGQCTFAPGVYLVVPNDRTVKHRNELSNQGNFKIYLSKFKILLVQKPVSNIEVFQTQATVHAD